MASPLAGENVTELLLYLNFLERFRDIPRGFNVTLFADSNSNVHDIGDAVVGVGYSMTALSFVVVCLRLYMRRTRGLQRWGWDDWFIIPAMLATIGFTVIEGIVTTSGCVGKHVYDSSVDSISRSYIYEYTGTMVYAIASQLIRTSVLLFIGRLSISTRVKHIVMFSQIAVFGAFAGCVLTLTFACDPVSAVYDLSVAIQPSTQCYAIWKPLLAWSIVFALSDIWLVILPMTIVWHLRVPRATRLGIILVFSCGFVACLAAVVKASTIRLSYNSFDACYKFTITLILSHLELTFGLIVASLPALNTLILRYVPSTIKRSSEWGPSPRDGVSPNQLRFQAQEQGRPQWEVELERERSIAEHLHKPSNVTGFIRDETGIGVAVTTPAADTRRFPHNRESSTPLSFERGTEEPYYGARASGPQQWREDGIHVPAFFDIAPSRAEPRRPEAEEQTAETGEETPRATQEEFELDELSVPLGRPIVSFADSEYSVELVLQRPS